ncbi:hypothetical protein SteCoe_35886 [Stentor coeruleus]|uniref:Arf-GAP domain-containing protein n=1 Tax=Stentor coeruleus TaxID=5963 RepID=A0A1R2AR86_9CILI|nr:hypothetical protein SteCoe_35886 [Stentor coeruleus]
MVSQTTTEEIFKKLREDISNQTCADCGADHADFASISHGILICESCSIQHKNLGPSISFVKSLYDNWSIRQLKLMTVGGNATLKSFFSSYNMPETAKIDFKYNTVASKYYREMLKVMAEGESCTMQTPSLEQGLELLIDPKTLIKDEVVENPIEEKKTSGLFGGIFGSAFNTTVSLYGKVKDSDTYKKIEGKAVETAHKVGQSIKKGAQKGIEIGKETVGWSAQKGYENLERGANAGVNILRSGAHSAYDTMTKAAAGTYNQINLEERSRKLKEDSMSILIGLEKNTVGKVFSKNQEEEGEGEGEERKQEDEEVKDNDE